MSLCGDVLVHQSCAFFVVRCDSDLHWLLIPILLCVLCTSVEGSPPPHKLESMAVERCIILVGWVGFGLVWFAMPCHASARFGLHKAISSCLTFKDKVPPCFSFSFWSYFSTLIRDGSTCSKIYIYIYITISVFAK